MNSIEAIVIESGHFYFQNLDNLIVSFNVNVMV